MQRAGALPFRRRRGDVIGVAVGGVAGDLGQDVGAARDCRLALFEDQRRGALGHHEAVALASKGRLAASGASLRVDSARIAMNPPMPSEVSAASAPPVIAASM